jgi:hypothetical protein
MTSVIDVFAWILLGVLVASLIIYLHRPILGRTRRDRGGRRHVNSWNSPSRQAGARESVS